MESPVIKKHKVQEGQSEWVRTESVAIVVTHEPKTHGYASIEMLKPGYPPASWRLSNTTMRLIRPIPLFQSGTRIPFPFHGPNHRQRSQ
jgi:hypothetical protein